MAIPADSGTNLALVPNQVAEVLTYASPLGIAGLILGLFRWRVDARARRREQLQHVGELVAAVQNAAGSMLVLTSGHLQESRWVMATRYALNNLRSALVDTKHPLPRCRELAEFHPVVPRTIEGNIWPMAGLASDEVDLARGLTPVADAPWRDAAA